MSLQNTAGGDSMKKNWLKRLVIFVVATVFNLLIYYKVLLTILPIELAISLLVVLYITEQAVISELCDEYRR